MRTLPDLLSSTKARWTMEGLRVSPFALILGGLLIAAFALRLIWVLYIDTIPLGGDPHWYYVVGINLSQGFGFVAARNELFEIPGPGEPTAFWPPGYPFALASVFKVFGVSITSAKVLNAILGTLTIPFIYAIGNRIFGRGPGLLAAGLFAFVPATIAGLPVLFPEPLFTLIFVAALWLLVTYPMNSQAAWLPLVVFGALIGMAMLTRGQGAVLVPIAVLYWFASGSWRSTIRPTAIALLVAASIIAPWTVRNAVEMHAFIPISTNSGAALRVGHAPDSIGTTRWTDDDIGGFRMWESMYKPEWEVQGYREYTRLAINYALTHPRRELELSVKKIYHLYRSDGSSVDWLETLGTTRIEPEALRRALPGLIDYSYYALLIAAAASVPLWLRRDARRWMLINVVLMWTVFHAAFLGEPRYHVPLYPIFVIAAAGGIWALIAALRDRLGRSPGNSQSNHA